MMFSKTEQRVDWFLCIEHTRRLDYAIMYLCTHITEIILAFCLLYPNGISREVKRLIFILCILDIIHYFTFSSIGFESEKLIIAFILSYGYKQYKKKLCYE